MKKKTLHKYVEYSTHPEFMKEWKKDNKNAWKCFSSGYNGKVYWRKMEKDVKTK